MILNSFHRMHALIDRTKAKVENKLKLNLGCGPVQPEGWVNIDGSNRAWLAAKLPWVDRFLTGAGILPKTEFGAHVKFLNLLKPLPYENNSVACIYAGELWEHFEYPDAVRLTSECFRVLARGGVLRVCVPDGPAFWRRYVEIVDQMMAQPRQAREAAPLRKHIQMHFDDICTKKKWLGSMGHTHKWEFDEVQLIDLFESQGFSSVERMPYHQSRIEGIASIERSNFLIVEGVKPTA